MNRYDKNNNKYFNGHFAFENWKQFARDQGCSIRNIGCGAFVSEDRESNMLGLFDTKESEIYTNGDSPRGRHVIVGI